MLHTEIIQKVNFARSFGAVSLEYKTVVEIHMGRVFLLSTDTIAPLPPRFLAIAEGAEVKGDMAKVRNEYICISGPLPSRYWYKVYRSTSLPRLPNMHASRPGPTVHTASTNAHVYNTWKRELPISLQTRDVHSLLLPPRRACIYFCLPTQAWNFALRFAEAGELVTVRKTR